MTILKWYMYNTISNSTDAQGWFRPRQIILRDEGWYGLISLPRAQLECLSRSKSPAGMVLLLLNTTILPFLYRISGMIWLGCADIGDDMAG